MENENLTDHSQILCELVMNSIDAKSTKIYALFDLMNNKIIVKDNGFGMNNIHSSINMKSTLLLFNDDSCEDNSFYFKRNKGHLKNILNLAEKYCIKTWSINNQRDYYKNFYENYNSNLICYGTEIYLENLFYNSHIHVKNIIHPNYKIFMQKKVLKFINSLSLSFPKIDFQVEGCYNNKILNLQPVMTLDDRFQQICGLRPTHISDNKITTDITLTLEIFEPFLVNKLPCYKVITSNSQFSPGSRKWILLYRNEIKRTFWDERGLVVEIGNVRYASKNNNEVGPDKIQNLEFIGIWNRKFILGKYENVLYAIDQHAAHERINLSKLIERSNTERKKHIMQKPIDMSQFGIILNNSITRVLSDWGWTFSGSSLITIPIICNIIIDDIEGLIDFIKNLNDNILAFPECIMERLRTRACRTALKFGDHIDETRAKFIITELSKTDIPTQCAHGRPVIRPIYTLTDS